MKIVSTYKQRNSADATCRACEHFRFDPGSPAYSEVTPGTDWSMYCTLDEDSKFYIYGYETYQEDMRKILLQAATCKHFKHVVIKGETDAQT